MESEAKKLAKELTSQEYTFTFKSDKYLPNEAIIIKVTVYNNNVYRVDAKSMQIPIEAHYTMNEAYLISNSIPKDAYSVAQECFKRFMNNE